MRDIFKVSKEYYGKVIYADRSLYRHYGIGVEGGSVIHFEPDVSECGRVVISSAHEFSGGSGIRICHRTHGKYAEDKIVERAYSKLYSDFGGYDLLNNNCEHFARWASTGQASSTQVFFKNDEKDIVEKAIDIIFEPGAIVCGMIDDAIDSTIGFFKKIFA